MQTVKKGNKGEAVELVQLMLHEKGYDSGTADGIFGTKTGESSKKLSKGQGPVGRRDRGEQHVRQAVYRMPVERRQPGRAGKSAANKAE